ncbi:unnamed protein product [Adineta ricciae]|uniref:Fe2OG dioxygenase domain-containing protein n=1 Tax=Adineta ricciae TaxID=249248 RepID=A0A813Y0T4_ADIRI|nr:unnamed protein product [Adineta ricciae]CAF1005255.1 unnamed protein product [Adineta ricciae]
MFYRNSLRKIHTLINHKLYPLNDHQSDKFNQLITTSREEFHSTGCLYLPNFLTQSTLSTILHEIDSIVKDFSQNLFHSYVQHTDNLYNTSSNSPEMESSSKTIIAYDQIPSNSLLRKIYSSNSLIHFLTQIIQIYPQLYPSCDKLGALYVNIYRQANRLSWHTDHSHFFINLLLQQASDPDEGIFEYKTDKKIISRHDFQSGGLVMFNGRKYLHRVTKVCTSKSPRINAILTYDCTREHQLSEYVLQKFFGRTT